MKVLVLLLAGMAASVPTTLWARSGANPVRRVDADQHELFAPRWTMQLVRTGRERNVGVSFGRPGLSPELGIAVATTGEGRVIGLRASDGTVVWQRRENVVFSGAVSIVRDPADGEPLAVFGSEDGALWAVRVRDGERHWRVELGGTSRAPVTVAEESLMVTTLANRIARVAIATGEIAWMRGRTRPSGLTINGHGSAAVDGFRAYAGFSDGYVEAYDLTTGATVWSRQLSTSDGPFGDVDADPVLMGDLVFVASYADGIYALSALSGDVLWRAPATAVASLAAATGRIVAASADGIVLGLDPQTGRRIYRTRIPAGPVSRMQVRDGLVLLGAGDSGLLVLDAASGQPLQASPLGSRTAGDPTWQEKSLLILSESGRLFAMQRSAATRRDD